MALDTAAIKLKLSSVNSSDRRAAARNIINGASATDLKGLDTEGALRLWEAIVGGVLSADDKAALKRLAAESQFQPVKTPDFAVDLIKKAKPTKIAIQSELTADLVTRIYSAEKKRLSWAEQAGIDGDTIGRGQLGQTAYDDVKSARHFKNELEKCVFHYYVSKTLNAPGIPDVPKYDGNYKWLIPTQYTEIYRNIVFEDFVVTAYLAILFEMSSANASRSAKDAARFGVARYHGMFPMVRAAQVAVKDDVNWAPVEKQLRAQGNTDECDYVNEVVI